MTGIVAGEGLGLYNGSLAHLNGFGAQGNARLGNGNDRAWVNAANGNLVIQSQDDYLAALGLDVMATRTYNSRGLLDDDNGDNWQLSFYRRLLNLPAGAGTGEITRVNGDGHRAVFTYDSGTGKWISTDGSGAHDTLSKVGSEWVYEEGSSGLRETFDSNGKIIKAQDRDGHGLAFDYNGAGTLITAVRVVDATGATVETTKLTYSGNRLTNIRIDRMDAATDAIRVRYTYDGQGRLSQVRVDLGNPNDITAESGINRYTTTYTYDGTSNRLAGISQSDGSELLITYVQVGNDYRVASLAQREAVVQGSPVYRTTTFNYDIADRRTDVTDALGLVTHYHYDTQQRLTRVVSPEASNGVRSTTEYQYDSDDNITRVTTSVTGSTSRAVDYAYDSNGNLTEVRDAGGNTVRRSYNAQNQLSTETVYLTPDPDGAGAGQPGNGLTTRYLYDNEQHLRFIISAEGRVTENRYHANGHAADGQIQSSILHTGQLYSGGSYTEAALESWVNGLSDKQLAERIDYTYDARGQRASQTRYTALDSSGNGIPADSATSRYVYSAAGELLMSIGARNTSGSPTAGDAHVTSYTYDGLGRLRTLQDGSGRISTTSYDAANNTVVTSAPHGLVTTTVYNRAGDRISQQQTAGATDYGTTRYHYDQNSRLRMTEDATGARTHYLYDSRGWQVGMINPEGELTETVYNDAGQIVQVIRYDGRLDPDALVDVDGNPLSFTLDQLRGGTPASPLNPRPVTDLNGVDPGTDHSISDNQASILVAPDATLNDDGSTLTTLTAIILDAPDGIAETLSVNTAGTNLVANWDASRNLLTVTGSGGTARAITQFQQVLRTLSYSNSGGSPTLGARQVQIAVDDGEDHSIVRISTVTLTGPNQGPVVDLNGGAAGTGSSASYAEGAPATTIANPALTVSDADDATLSSAQVVINGRQNGTAEVLSVTTSGTGISASFNASTGVLTLTGTASVADYQQVLRTLKYENSASPMTGSSRTIAFTVSDGIADSGVAVLNLSLVANAAPVVDLNGAAGGIHFAASFDEGDPATLIVSPSLTISDADGSTLSYLQVALNNRQDGSAESLSVDVGATGISANYNASTGVLLLSGTATLADYQQVLRTLKYQNTAVPMTGVSRTVAVSASDGISTSTVANVTLTLVPAANFAPVVDLNGPTAGTGYSTTFTEGDTPVLIVGSTLTVSDPNPGATIAGATITLTNLADGAAENLSVITAGTGLSASYNSSTGVLTLSGVAAPSIYEQVLRTLRYENASQAPTAGDRSISVAVTDGQDSSASAYSTVTVVPVNDAPVLDMNGAAIGTQHQVEFPPLGLFVFIGQELDLSDVDSLMLTGATVTIADILPIAESFQATTSGTPISGSASGGVFTLSGTATVAEYEAVLRTLRYRRLTPGALMGQDYRDVLVTVTDGQDTSEVGVVRVWKPGQMPQGLMAGGGGEGGSQLMAGEGLQLEGAGSSQTQSLQPQPLSGEGGAPLMLMMGGTPLSGAATNRITSYVYDVAGRQIFTLVDDSEGSLTRRAVTETVYDGAGRITKTIAYANRIAPDALTEAAVRGALSTSGDDRISRNFYDGDGLLLAALDGEGGLTEQIYDDGGRLIEQVAYATATNPSHWASGSLTDLRPGSTADDQRSHHLYDARGQKTATIDAEGHLSTWAYDDAGNTVEERRYTGTVSYSGQSVATLQSQAIAATPAGQLRYRASEWVYDSLNRQTETRDILAANGGGLTTLSTTTYAYDTDSGFLISSTHAANDAPEARTTTTDYDHLGRITRQLDGEGSQALAAAAPGAAQEAVWTAYGAHNEHDDAGRVIRSTDASGNTSYYYYDHANRLRYSINAAGEVQETTYNAFGEAADIIIYANRISTAGITGGLIEGDLPGLSPDANRDRKTTISYTLRGQADIRQDGEGFQIDRDYNAFGQLHTQRSDSGATPGARTRTDTWSYDRRGLTETSLTDSGGLNLSRSREYDTFGRLTGETDARGHLWQTAYDKLGRVLTTTDPLSQTQGAPTTYDAFGRVLTQTDKLGHTTAYQYDDLQRKTTVTSPEGIVTTRTRNAHGEVIEIRLAQAGDDEITRYSYNRDGQLEATVNDMGSAPDLVTTNEYNPAGLLSAVVDARGIRTEYSYDAANRIMTRVIDPGSGTNPLTGEAYLNLSTSYDYNSGGEAIKVTDARGVVTETVFDRKGQTVAVIVDTEGHGGDAPLRLATEYSYDGQGQRITVREGITATPTGTGWNTSGTALRTTAYVYDTAGRRTEEIVDPNGLQITTRYFYDNNNNLTLREDAEGHKWWTVYDGNNRAVFSVSPDGAVRETVYDAEGRATLTTRYAAAANTAGLGQVIDEGNFRSTQVQPSASDRHTAMAYDHDGRMTHQVQGFTLSGGTGTGGYLTEFTHDAAGRTQRMTTYAVAAGASYVLTDAGISGQAAAVADATRDRSEHYYYDAAGRERFHIDATGYLRERLYDASGNLLAEHRYSDTLGAGTIAGLGTTADVQAVVGNASGAGDQSDTYDYDAASRLSGMTDAENHSEAYQLDGAGNRIAFQNKNGHTWTYQYDGAGRMVSETTPEVDYVDGITVTPGSGVYEPDVDLNEVSGTAIETAITYDRLGNVKTRTEAVGTTVERTTTYHYDGAGRQTTVEYPEMDGIMDPLTGVVTDNVQAQTQTWLDGRGNAVVNQDLNGHISRKTYDETGRVQYEIDAEGYVTEYHYNALGDRTQVIRYADAVNMAGYGTAAVTSSQVAGLVASITGNRTVEYQYDLHGQVTKTLLPEVYYYDAATGTSGNRQPETQMQYNAFGEVELQRKLRNTQGGGQWDDTYYYYNQRGERTGQIDPGGYLTEWEHDAHGNVTRQLEWADKLSAWSLVGGSIPQGYAPPTADSVNYGDTSDDVTLIWDQDFSSGTSGLTGSGLSAPSNVSLSGGKLHLVSNNSNNTSDLQPIRVVGARSYGNDDHPVIRFEFSVGAGTLGQQSIGVTSWPPTGTAIYAYEHQLLIESKPTGADNIRFYGKGAGESSTISLTDGVTYELEIAVNDSGSTMYLHQKGAARGSLAIHRENGESNQLVATAAVRNSTALPSSTAVLSIDSMEEVSGAAFNDVDALASRQARNVREVVYKFDGLNRLIAEERVGYRNDAFSEDGNVIAGVADAVTAHVYDAVGNLISTVDPSGAARHYYYDALGRLHQELAPERSYVVGTQPLQTETDHPLTEYHYNALGHVVQKHQFATGVSYSSSSAPATPSASAADKVETYLVDLHGRLQTTVDPMNVISQSRYDRMGRVVSERLVPDAGDTQTVESERRFIYDSLGNRTETWTLRDSAFSKEMVRYNAFGEIDARGANGSFFEFYEYDNAGRIWRSNRDGAARVMLHDLVGNANVEILSDELDLLSSAYQEAAEVADISTGIRSTHYLYNRNSKLVETRLPGISGVYDSQTSSPALVPTFHVRGESTVRSGAFLAWAITAPHRGVNVEVRLREVGSSTWQTPEVIEGAAIVGGNQAIGIDLSGFIEGAYEYELDYFINGSSTALSKVVGETWVYGPQSLVNQQQELFAYSVVTGPNGNPALKISAAVAGATQGMTALEFYSGYALRFTVPVTSIGGGEYVVEDLHGLFTNEDAPFIWDYVRPVGTAETRIDAISYDNPNVPNIDAARTRHLILQQFEGGLPYAALPLLPQVDYFAIRKIGETQWNVSPFSPFLLTMFRDREPYEFRFRLSEQGGGYIDLTAFGGTADGWIEGTHVPRAYETIEAPTETYSGLSTIVRYQDVDRWGNVTRVVDALGNITSYRYDEWGNLLSETLPEVDIVAEQGAISVSAPVTRWAYDQLGRRVAEVDARGNTQALRYDGASLVVDEVDPTGATRAFGYDIFGRAVYIQRPDQAAIVRNYDKHDNVLSEFNGARTIQYEYDAAGRLREDEFANYSYNEAGDLVARTISGVTTTFEYDAGGRKAFEHDAINGYQQWQYDDWGRVLTFRGIDGDEIVYEYNYAGQLTDETSLDYRRSYDYWENGWLRRSSIEYAPYADYPIASPRSTAYYDYDSNGRVVRQYELGVQHQVTQYDAHGRVVFSSEGPGNVTYQYDAVGNRRSATATAEDREYQVHVKEYWFFYDQANRVRAYGEGSRPDPRNYLDNVIFTEYQYDRAGQRISQMTRETDYLSVSERTIGAAFYEQIYGTAFYLQGHERYEYDLAGQLTNVRDGLNQNEVISRRYYDTKGRVYYYQVVDDFSRYYLYDNSDRLDQMLEFGQDNDITSNYQYDSQGRLTRNDVTATGPGGYTAAYQYTYVAGPTGYLEKTVTATRQGVAGQKISTSTYDARGQLITVMAPFDLSGPGLSKRVSYNVAGEVVARRDSDQPSERGGTRYISVGGNPLGRYGTPSTPDAPFIDFNYNVDPVSDEYPASVPGSYIVSEQGETVRDVARAVYGDANLWYLVADANALAPDDVLRPGQVLSVPNAVQPSGNTADTFRPIGDLVGDTRPDLPVPPPPPDKSCGTFGIILVIVVAVVVSVVSFNTLSGPATAAVSSVLGGSTAAGAVATTGGAILAGTAAGAAASAASQLTAIAAGLQDDFSWSDVGRSALQSGLTAGALQGFGLVGPDADALSWLGDFAEVGRAVVSNAVSQGIGMGLDMQDEFNWNALAGTTAASSLVGVTGTAVDRLSLSPNGFSETFLQQFAAGTINTGTQMLLEGGGKLDVRSIAADAFGNALGNSIVGAIQFAQLPEEVHNMSAADRQKFQQYRDQFTNISGDEADRLAIEFVNDSNNPGLPEQRLDLISRGLVAAGSDDPNAVLQQFGISNIVNGAEGAYLSANRGEAYFDQSLGRYMYPGDAAFYAGGGVGGFETSALDLFGVSDGVNLQAPELSGIGQALRTAAPVLAPVGEATAKLGQYIDSDPVLKFATFAVGAAISPVQTLLTAAIEPTPIGQYVNNLTTEGYEAYTGYIENVGQFNASDAQAVGAGAFGVSSLVLFGVGSLAKVGRVLGGPYSRVRGIPGNEAHHIPANSASPLSKREGPAISMEREDHMQTGSYGGSKEADAYRQQQRELIDAGDFRAAQQMDFDDIRSKFGTKYDPHIKQLQEYTDELFPPRP